MSDSYNRGRKTSPKEVYEWLLEHGPAHTETIADQLDASESSVSNCVDWLTADGSRGISYVTWGVDFDVKAHPLDDVPIRCGMFGAGAGETTEAEIPTSEKL